MPTQTDLHCPVCGQYVLSCTCSIETIRKWAGLSSRSLSQKSAAKAYIEERDLLRGEIQWEERQRKEASNGKHDR